MEEAHLPQTSPAPTPVLNADTSPPKTRKRPRAAEACDRCRSKKYKCDESYPCAHCKKQKVECVYQSGYRHRGKVIADNYVSTLEQKVTELTAKLNGAGDLIALAQTRPPSMDESTVVYSHARPPSCHPSQPQPLPGANGHALSTASDVTAHASDHRSVPLPPRSNSFRPDDDSSEDVDDEVADVNQHTNDVEFHGSSSSMAFLGRLQRSTSQLRHTDQQGRQPTGTNPSLVSALHNPNFSPLASTAPKFDSLQESRFYFRQAHIFMDGYFENLHFIHPFIDKEDFTARAQDLWFDRAERIETSFMALYLSLISLGALIRVWDETRLAGLTRFEWSRKLFNEAKLFLHELSFSNDLETVQCLILMAKICQNELNPHLAYMYLGIAIRICFSAGFNRETSDPKRKQSRAISKTWWALYSLEIEMSFSLGRPDTLGMDQYHNRRIPDLDDSEVDIIPSMAEFGKIMRKVSADIYHGKSSLQQKLDLALQTERDMDQFFSKLPVKIQPILWQARAQIGAQIGGLREAKWSKRQRLVLSIRYHNVKILLFRPFLTFSIRKLKSVPAGVSSAVGKCIGSAKRMIEIIHDTFRLHTFFRAWWYNTTYVTFASSILLLYITRQHDHAQSTFLIDTVEMAVEILEAMDESVVATKSAEIIKASVQEAKKMVAERSTLAEDPAISSIISGSGDFDPWRQDLNVDFNIPDYSFDGMSSLFDDFNGFSQGFDDTSGEVIDGTPS